MIGKQIALWTDAPLPLRLHPDRAARGDGDHRHSPELAVPRYFPHAGAGPRTVLKKHNLAILREAIDKHYADLNEYPESLPYGREALRPRGAGRSLHQARGQLDSDPVRQSGPAGIRDIHSGAAETARTARRSLPGNEMGTQRASPSLLCSCGRGHGTDADHGGPVWSTTEQRERETRCCSLDMPTHGDCFVLRLWTNKFPGSWTNSCRMSASLCPRRHLRRLYSGPHDRADGLDLY